MDSFHVWPALVCFVRCRDPNYSFLDIPSDFVLRGPVLEATVSCLLSGPNSTAPNTEPSIPIRITPPQFKTSSQLGEGAFHIIAR